MAISWNEIKDRALKFSNEWADEKKNGQKKIVFGMTSSMYLEFPEGV